VAPFVTRRVQTDNGSEFAKHFDDYCRDSGLNYFFNYPKHPESNSYLERFNRTIQSSVLTSTSTTSTSRMTSIVS
jgi:transposase InsO family protein